MEILSGAHTREATEVLMMVQSNLAQKKRMMCVELLNYWSTSFVFLLSCLSSYRCLAGWLGSLFGTVRLLVLRLSFQ